MSSMIDREGRFRGKPESWCVDKSTGGFPQFVVRLVATEMFNEDTGEWEDWDFGQSLTAYLILFNNDKAMLNYEQVMKAFGWDGQRLADLQETDHSNAVVQFVVRENEYNGKISLRIEWVGEPDENPVRTLSPMDTNALSQLNAQFAHFMTPKATAAPAKAPVKKSRKKKASGPPERAPVPVKDEPDAVGCTKEEAWKYLATKKPKDKSDDQLAEAWIAGCDKLCKDRKENDDDNFTPENWMEVRTIAATALKIIS